MHSNPKISVIIPAFNMHASITSAIDSVYATGYKNIEIILSDDGSDKSYNELLTKYQDIKIIKSEINLGAGVARQRALNICTGEWISFLDADDLLSADIFKIFLIDDLTDIDMILYEIMHIDKDKIKRYSAVKDNGLLHGCIFKKTFLQKYNIHFDYTLRIYEDTYFKKTACLFAKNIKAINKIGYILKYNPTSTTAAYENFLEHTPYEMADAICCFLEKYKLQIPKSDILFEMNHQIDAIFTFCSSPAKIKQAIFRFFDCAYRIFRISSKSELKKIFCLSSVHQYIDRWLEHNEKIKLSIIIPLYNSHQYIKNTLDSLYKTLGKRINETEIILTDNCSEEPYYGYLQNFKNMILLTNDTNIRMGKNRNRGLDIAKGEFITFLDHEDKLSKKAIEDIFCKDLTGINIAMGKTKNILHDDLTDVATADSEPYYCIELIHGVFFRRTFLNDSKLRFSTQLKTSEDSYFMRTCYFANKYLHKGSPILKSENVYYYWEMYSSSCMNSQYNNRQYAEEFKSDFIRALILSYSNPFVPYNTKLQGYLFAIIDLSNCLLFWSQSSKNFKKYNIKVLLAFLLLLEKEFNVNRDNFIQTIEFHKNNLPNPDFDNSLNYFIDNPFINLCFDIIENLSELEDKKQKLLNELQFSKIPDL